MKTRSIYLDAIKVLAIILVVFNHTAHLIDVDDFFSRVVLSFCLIFVKLLFRFLSWLVGLCC